MGRIAGIPIVLAPSWFLMAGVITFVYSGVVRESLGVNAGTAAIVAFGFAVLLAASVLLHELGHCVVSKALGLPVRRVVLFLLGGVSEIDRDPQRPGDEYLVAIAGPLVSILLAGLGGIALVQVDTATIGGELLFQFTVANGLVAVFNLLPGLPLDGGRLLRAGVWRLTDSHLSGTTAAVFIGRGVALAVVAFAVVRLLAGDPSALPGVVLAVLLAAMIWFSAGQSLAAARMQDRMGSIAVTGVMRRVLEVQRDLPVAELLRRAEAGALDVIAVVDPDGRPVGVAQISAAHVVPERARPWTAAADIGTPVVPATVLPHTLQGPALLAAVKAHPAPEYVVTDGSGAVIGVLIAADLATALTGNARQQAVPQPPQGNR